MIQINGFAIKTGEGLTSVARDTTSGTGRGEEYENVAEELDVRLERRALLLCELLLARVEREPGGLSSRSLSSMREPYSLLEFLDVNRERLVDHGGKEVGWEERERRAGISERRYRCRWILYPGRSSQWVLRRPGALIWAARPGHRGPS
jgi:hypothetical protein